MADIGVPFCFVKPARDASHSVSTPSCLVIRSTLAPDPFFPYFMKLPIELRTEIIRIAVDDALPALNQWCRTQSTPETIEIGPETTQSSPVMLQSRRGILFMQVQHKQPPSLPQLACVSTEWQEEIEKRFFENLTLADGDSDIVAFSDIVTGPRRRHLYEVTLGVYGEDSEAVEDPYPYFTAYGLKTVTRLFQILSTWDADYPLTVRLNIEPQEFSLLEFRAYLINVPVVPVIGSLHINMDPHVSSKPPLALLQLLRKLPHLMAATLHLSPWCYSNEAEKDLYVLCQTLHLFHIYTKEH